MLELDLQCSDTKNLFENRNTKGQTDENPFDRVTVAPLISEYCFCHYVYNGGCNGSHIWTYLQG